MDEEPVNRMSRTERRLRSKLEPGDELQTWARGWVSRDGRMNPVFAARNLDYCVLGSHNLYLVSTGFFTRRPRRTVYLAPLDELIVGVRNGGPPPRLRLTTREYRALRLDLRRNARSQPFADALLRASTPPPRHP
jgi:hypothetical protein